MSPVSYRCLTPVDDTPCVDTHCRMRRACRVFWSPVRTGLLFVLLTTMIGCGKSETNSIADPADRQIETASDGAADAESINAQAQTLVDSGSHSNEDRGELISTAGRHLKANQLDQARRVLRSLIVKDSSDVEAIFLLARCEAADGDLSLAVELLGEIPDDHSQAGLPALGQAADWLMQQGDLQAAAQRYERVLQVHGDVVLVHRRLAKIRNDQGERFSARKHLRFLLNQGNITLDEIIAINCISSPFYDAETLPPPGEGDSLTDLTHARQFYLDEDFESAARMVSKLSKRFPAHLEVHAFYGRVLNGQQDDLALHQWAQNLPAGIDGHPEYWLAVGEWLLRSGSYEQATRALCESALLDSTNRATYGLLSTCLIALDKQELANAVSRRYSLLHDAAVALWNVNSPEANDADYQTLAVVLAKLRRYREALMWQMIAAGQNPQGQSLLTKLRAEFDRTVEDQASQTNDWVLCGLSRDDFPLPTLLPQVTPPRHRLTEDRHAKIRLVDIAKQAGLDFQFRQNADHDSDNLYMFQIMGGGIAAADYDRDGWCDLYFTQAKLNDSTEIQSNQLFRNLDGKRFLAATSESSAEDSSHGQGVTAADLNQDGFPDFVVANIGEVVVLWNNGDGTFRRSEPLVPPQKNRWSTSVGSGDLNGDQLPDLVVVNYIDDPKIWTKSCFGADKNCNPRLHQAAADHFFAMSATGDLEPFVPGTQSRLFGLGVLIGNLDGLAGNDVLIANDTDVNQLWVSRDGSEGYTLHEEALPRGVAATSLGDAPGCMGIAKGDFDRDGTLDIHITNFVSESSNLYMQNDRGLFFEKAALFGLRNPTYPMVGFGTQAVDLDHDGWLDLAVVNGHVTNSGKPSEPYQMLPQLFRGTGDAFELIASDESVGEYWSTAKLGRSLAVLDFNCDGKMDLAVSHLDRPAALLDNQSETKHWIQFQLVGTSSERDAIGAQIKLVAGDQKWSRWVTSGDGFHCRNESMIHVGLGNVSDAIDRLDIQWPSGRAQSFSNLSVDRRWMIIEGQGEAY